MKFKDAEIGMKVKRIWKDHKDVKKGHVYTIERAICGGVRLEGLGLYWYDLSLFEPAEPVNEFENGEEVIYKAENGKNYKSVIFGIAKQKDKFDGRYAISFVKGSDRVVNKVVKGGKLSPLKKPDELEVGDKFRVKTAEGASGRINEVLGVFEDKYYNQTKYVAKRMNGNYEGFVDIYNSEMIAEIIYN